MNRALRRRREREDAHEVIDGLKKQVVGLTDAKVALLDVVNALVLHAGGRAEIPLSTIEGHKRKEVEVEVTPPDPEAAGDSGHYIITLRGYEPPAQADSDVARRMKERGLWLPGEDA